MNRIRKGDGVMVITGKDKGKRGIVLARVDEMTVLVEGVNRVKKHTKANPMKGQTGGIIDKEMPIKISNIALYNATAAKVDRVGIRLLDDGRKVRVFRSTGEAVDA